MKKLKLISLFCGCGGLDFGFKQVGFKTILANDIDKDSCNSFYNFLNIKPICCDLKKIINSLPYADIVIGGPPCQSFSLLGKRNKDDLRGKEVFNFLYAIEKIRPKVILFENVPGIINSTINNIRLSDYIINQIKKLGYNILFEKLDCTEFLIPQTRKRYILIAWEKNLKKPIICNKEKLSSFLKLKLDSEKTTIKNALGDLPKPVKNGKVSYLFKQKTFFQRFCRKFSDSKFTTVHYNFHMSPKDIEYINYIKPGGNYMDIPNRIASKRVKRIKKTGGRTTTYGRLHPEKFSATINTYFNRPNVGTNYHYNQKRLITPREALRIQSFPDTFTPEYKSIRSICKQIGNAVPPLFSIFLALTVKSIFRK